MAHIVLTTFGSLGDLHPYLAIGLALKQRGHDVVIATHGVFRARTETLGLAFAPIRPDFDRFGGPLAVMREVMDSRRGSEILLKRMVLPSLRETRDDLLAVARGADVIVDHVLSFTSPLVAETLGIPRVSTALQPFTMFSAYDPPPATPWLDGLRRFGPLPWQLLWAVGRASTRHWFRDLHALRAEMWLPSKRAHPMMRGKSRALHLALFSQELGAPQPDWPACTVQPGFPLHDRDQSGGGISIALTRFLDAGDPPLVFTLGSSAVFAAGNFYAAAAEAARMLGRRAVLLTGGDDVNQVPGVPPVEAASPDDLVVTVGYAPHSEIMPRAAAVIHQGGVGTTAQAMLSGRPMLVVPFSHDQPDNAERCRRLGVARTLQRADVSAQAIARELSALLADNTAARNAAAVARRMRGEAGARGAAEALETLLHRGPG